MRLLIYVVVCVILTLAFALIAPVVMRIIETRDLFKWYDRYLDWVFKTFHD